MLEYPIDKAYCGMARRADLRGHQRDHEGIIGRGMGLRSRVHDRVMCTGVVERLERNGEQLVRVEVQAATHRGEVTLTGEAVVAMWRGRV
jgi:hypothetical protein